MSASVHRLQELRPTPARIVAVFASFLVLSLPAFVLAIIGASLFWSGAIGAAGESARGVALPALIGVWLISAMLLALPFWVMIRFRLPYGGGRLAFVRERLSDRDMAAAVARARETP